MPAKRTSRPSSRTKVRPSLTLAALPAATGIGSHAEAAPASSAVANTRHNATARQMRLVLPPAHFPRARVDMGLTETGEWGDTGAKGAPTRDLGHDHQDQLWRKMVGRA